jgi:deoxyribonuclease IV
LKRVGLHQRITTNLTELIQKAIRLKLPLFQFFVTDKKTGQVLKPRSEDVQSFLSYRRAYFNNLYLHSSYFINLADPERSYHPLLQRELRLAKKLECSHIILHAGAVRSIEEKRSGIDAVARMMNLLFKRESNIQFLLENSAFGPLSIGSDIKDFSQILNSINYPEKIGFCIDTVHAHVSGYDIVSKKGYLEFINFLEEAVGLERIKLIHLNETEKMCGSCCDIHCCIGDSEAQIGETALIRFMSDKRLISAELLSELPAISEENEQRILERLNRTD